jgi:hypothetical protein
MRGALWFISVLYSRTFLGALVTWIFFDSGSFYGLDVPGTIGVKVKSEVEFRGWSVDY